MPKLTNISNGPRGVYGVNGLVMVEAGKEFDGELAKGEEPNEEWFAASGSAAADAASGDLSSLTKANLVDLAGTEGVAIETDDNKADIIAKIEAARQG